MFLLTGTLYGGGSGGGGWGGGWRQMATCNPQQQAQEKKQLQILKHPCRVPFAYTHYPWVI